jgi:hypothetical protein
MLYEKTIFHKILKLLHKNKARFSTRVTAHNQKAYLSSLKKMTENTKTVLQYSMILLKNNLKWPSSLVSIKKFIEEQNS